MVSHPFGQLGQGYDVVAMIIDCFGEQKMGDWNASFLVKQNMESILCDWGIDRRPFFLIELSPLGK
jgi:hypothetical protein